MNRAIYVAATGQNVGKTTVCLGLISGLKKRFDNVGYIKPVGQEHIEIETGQHVDKDVVIFKNHFQLGVDYEKMSPVLFPRGFTRNYLDGKVSRESLVDKITASYLAITEENQFSIIEGTGHTGVGSIVDLNNAQVASLLKSPVILISSGGLGSSFDELALNYAQCEKYGAKVAGVILNRVLDEKREMILEYMSKALKRWNIPLLGCIPFVPFLSAPTMSDFEILFETCVISGRSKILSHFEQIRLVASNVETYQLTPNQLIITPASREDVIRATIREYRDDLGTGLILTGKQPPKDSVIHAIKDADIPMLYIPISSFIAMKMINTHTTKIRKDDTSKIEEAVRIVEEQIDFDRLLGPIPSLVK